MNSCVSTTCGHCSSCIAWKNNPNRQRLEKEMRQELIKSVGLSVIFALIVTGTVYLMVEFI